MSAFRRSLAHLLSVAALAATAVALQAQPDAPSSTTNRELGFLRGQQGRMQEALALLKPWVEGHPDDVPARLAATQAAIELGLANEASGLLTGLDIEAPPVRVLRAQLARLRGDPKAILEVLGPVLETAPPGLAKLVDGLAADALVSLGRGREAAARLSRWVETDANLALLFAQASYQSGEAAAALAALAPWAHRFAPVAEAKGAPPAGAPALLLDYGRMLHAQGRSEEAVRMLEAGLSWNPDSHQGWLNLGQALVRLGRRDEAKQALERFRALDWARPKPGTESPPPSSPPG